MKTRSLFFSFTAGAMLAGASFALFQDAGMAGAVAGEEHALLKSYVGEWDAKISAMGTVSKGSHTRELAHNDLWLVEDFEGEMMGQPFTGHGIMGYDPAKEKYVGIWIDSMTPSLEPFEGTYDAEKKELTMHQESVNPMTGEPATLKYVTRIHDRDKHSFHMFLPGEEGTDMEMMTIEYTRKQ